MDAPLAFDPYDEATRRNPFPLYARARREHPVWAPDGAPVVSIFRYDDIQGVLRDPATWSNAFPPRMIRRLEPRMNEIAEELVNAALACGRVDLVEALTYPLPVIVIAEIIGIPAEDRGQFKVWSDTAVENLGAVFMG